MNVYLAVILILTFFVAIINKKVKFVRILNWVMRLLTLFWSLGLIVCTLQFLNYLEIKEIITGNIINIDGIVGEVIGGVVTALLIFLFYIIFSPIVEISHRIHQYPNGEFCIKAYNSGLFSIYDVKAYFTKVRPYKADNGKINIDMFRLPITFAEIEFVPSRLSNRNKDDKHLFAYIFAVKEDEDTNEIEDIRTVLKDQSNQTYYRFTISYRDSFSGIRRMKSEIYQQTNSVRKGLFKSGASFKVYKLEEDE